MNLQYRNIFYYFFHLENYLLLFCSNGRWRYSGLTYADSDVSQRSFPSDRNPGPLGDLYTSVDRTKDARARYNQFA